MPDTPASREPQCEYRLTRRVQFYETDAAGIVHFSSYFHYMEEAEHALWRAAGLSVVQPGSGLGWPRVAASFEYHRALHFEDMFDVWLRIAAIDTKTMRFVCLLSRDDVKIASGALTIACASHRPGEPMKGIPIPHEIADRFRVAPGVDV